MERSRYECNEAGLFGCLVRLLVGLAAVCGVLSFMILSRPSGLSGVTMVGATSSPRAVVNAQTKVVSEDQTSKVIARTMESRTMALHMESPVQHTSATSKRHLRWVSEQWKVCDW